jgi:hypothetical protein
MFPGNQLARGSGASIVNAPYTDTSAACNIEPRENGAIHPVDIISGLAGEAAYANISPLVARSGTVKVHGQGDVSIND